MIDIFRLHPATGAEQSSAINRVILHAFVSFVKFFVDGIIRSSRQAFPAQPDYLEKTPVCAILVVAAWQIMTIRNRPG